MSRVVDYSWVMKEVDQVKWRGFFRFQHCLDFRELAIAQERFGPLPEDYVSFIKEFGECRLFRKLRNGSYNLAVFANPRIIEGRNGEVLLVIGFYINGEFAHFRKPPGVDQVESGVFEGAGLQLRKSANSFEEWFKKRWGAAKRLYKKSEWKKIVAGATPFTDHELRLIDAMELFEFQRVGVAKNGDMQIQIWNGSDLWLSRLTIDVRAPGRLEGTIHVDVSEIGPGQSKIVEHDCYKSMVAADSVELLRKPRPEPEERDMIYALRT